MAKTTLPVASTDYVIYAQLIDADSQCGHETDQSHQNRLVLINRTTITPTADSLDEFDELTTFRRLATEYVLDTDWRSFLKGINHRKFTERTLSTLPKLQCRQAAFLPRRSDQQSFLDLQATYKNLEKLIYLSQVVYSPDRTKAICFYSETSTSDGGSGSCFLLEKRNSIWFIKKRISLWLS
ncbi:hypothetical protein [Fibrisoma limi]|uniref:hypothetical protein n=1 Tax=Fibrisoma limi TaxID=663275 RepID=UPI0002DABD6F|nr:hypothetical protein [Fibrisoma limi]